jgi:hypothetical protein
MTSIVQWTSSAFLLFGLPVVGILLGGQDPRTYLEMPPTTRYVEYEGFSCFWFALFCAIDVILIAGIGFAIACGNKRKPNPIQAEPLNFTTPWWGWCGLLLCLASWFLAWNRFTWFRLFQPHTFFPIWMGFILFVNALSAKRTGHCLLARSPVRFFLLFPFSAVFWWIFEYFNRFVQNWWYQTAIENLGPWQYTMLASIAFSTVLPAVLSIVDLLATFPVFGKGLARCKPVTLPSSKWIPGIGSIIACVGLGLIGIFPNQLFALLWVSPLIIIVSIQWLLGRPTLFHPIETGDWRPLVIPALAALICGFFWEMWNSLSLAKWSYTIPYVSCCHLFEMPVLGYGGYLPFGLECLVVGLPVVGRLFDEQR